MWFQTSFNIGNTLLFNSVYEEKDSYNLYPVSLAWKDVKSINKKIEY